MKKWHKIITLGIFIVIMEIFFTDFTYAYQRPTSSSFTASGESFNLTSSQWEVFNDLLDQANTYSNIESVVWAAATKAKSSNANMTQNPNVCTLWIAPMEDYSTNRIVIDDAKIRDGKYNVAVVGTCTKANGSNLAVDVRAIGSANYITLPTMLDRGGWNSPQMATATIDVEKFTEGLTPTISGNNNVFKRVLNVNRCHSDDGISSNGSCSQQDVEIILEVNDLVKYLAESTVSNSRVGSVSTGVVENYTRRNLSTATLRSGQNLSLTFTHNVYTNNNDMANNVVWQVVRSGNGWNYFGGTGDRGGNASFNYGMSSNYYVGGPLDNGFTSRAQLDSLTFRFTGYYEFCESLYIEGRQYTKVCMTVNVGSGGGMTETCSSWTPASYNGSNRFEGVTSVVTKVKNGQLNGTFSGWRGIITEGRSASFSTNVELDPDLSDSSNSEMRVTYAMPTDSITWQSCYWPGVQKTAYTDHTYLHGAHGVEGSTSNDHHEESDPYWGSWENKYSVSTSSGLIGIDGNKSDSYVTGDYWTIGKYSSYRQILARDVGGYFTQNIRTGKPVYVSIRETNHSWKGPEYNCTRCNCRTCCNSRGRSYCCGRESIHCTYWHSNSYFERLARINGPIESLAAVKVPYNFRNTISLSLKGGANSVVNAGDRIEIDGLNVEVRTRFNGVTERQYATRVDDASVKIVAYVSDTNGGEAKNVQARNGKYDELCSFITNKKQCLTTDEYYGTLNSRGNLALNGDIAASYSYWSFSNGSNFTDTTYNVFDASAGDYMCFVAAVYPASSGVDKMMYSSGSDEWAMTAPQCRLIVKKPSMQVLGGSVFSNGAINTNNTISTKHNLFSISNYDPHNAGATYFGSWVEEAVIANGIVNGLASGAALGRSGTNTIYGLSDSYDFCENQVPLSFANFSAAGTELAQICGQGADSAGKANIHTNTAINRTALLNYFLPSNLTDAGVSSVTLGYDEGVQIASGTGKDIRYVYHDGDLTVTGGSIVPNSTRIVKANGDIVISDSIAVRGESIDAATKVPKVVIYASKNIKIDCSVARVDAILIAGGTVYTCDSYTAKVTSSTSKAELMMRSQRQLVINGIVIADKVELARTYGNAVGDKSGTPAEIINYDTSSLIWAHSMAEASESSVMTTVYQHELAPRY